MATPSVTPSIEDPHNVLLRRLGAAGLLPFMGLALLVWLVEPDLQAWAAMAMAAYAALVVSFLGGIHWGAMWAKQQGDTAPVWWGIAPCLLAWPGVLMPPHAGLPWLGLLLVACYLVDRKLYPALGLSAWLTMRFRLSAVAALSCFIAAGAL
ncbi:MAG: hypothetical protein RJA09_1650 [Pseudomonadota bacterium]|jgi:hypothetical protein